MYRRRHQGWLKHLDFMIIDIVCMHIAFALSYITRHGWENPYANAGYRSLAIVLTLINIFVVMYNSSFKNVLKRGYYAEFAQAIKHVFWVEVLISLYMFVIQMGEIYSRIFFGFLGLYYLILSYCMRILWKQHLATVRVTTNCPALFIITTDERKEQIVHRLQEIHKGQYNLIGICITDRNRTGEKVLDVPVTTNLENVLEYLCREWVDEVYVSLPIDAECAKELLDGLAAMGLVIHMEMQYYTDIEWQKQMVGKMAGKTVLTVGMNFATARQIFFKRLIDIIGGLVGCLITILLTIIIGPLIFIQSPGPIFFSQMRIGKNGKPFKMYKFRSMYLDAEERKAELMKENRVTDGLMFKLDYDPRIIGCKKLPDGTIKKGLGNFIRDWSLDEFPQFFNVLLGSCSLVGTRPPTKEEWEKYDLHHRARLAFKPGITGLWQVSGRSNITDFEDVVKLDTKYIKEWTMGLDFRILLKTVQVVLKKDGAM